jgi:large subunit ribosomal protein L21
MVKAIVNISGKQYQVEEGRFLDIDTYQADVDSVLTFEEVLLVLPEAGAAQVGQPFVKGAQVAAKVLSHGRGRKILVFKMRCKKGYRRKNGHRQGFTRILVESIKAS